MKKKAWHSYVHLKRSKDQSIDDFIDNYDQACAELRKAGSDLGDEISALQLIESANLTDDVGHLVISGIDEEKGEVLDQTKASLRKFMKSDQCGMSFSSKDREEDVYVTGRFENNYKSSGRGRGNFRGNRGNRNSYGGRNGDSNFRQGSVNRSTDSESRRGGNNVNRGRGGKRGGKITRQKNPVDEDGNTLTCHICKSIFHFASDCPDSYENLENVYETNVNDDGSSEEAHQCDVQLEPAEVFVMESGDEGLLDTCCTSNVMGVEWKEHYFSGLSDADKLKVKHLKPSSRFKFGGEKPVESIEKLEFPVYIFGKESTLIADVVDRRVPLLISNGEMKKRQFTLYLQWRF